jgi:PTS system nitrogen regulatory IIA component
MPEIMTTKEIARYLKLHEITICKYAAEGQIPAIRIGRSWRFDKERIDKWISEGQNKPPPAKKSKARATPKARERQMPKKKKSNLK